MFLQRWMHRRGFHPGFLPPAGSVKMGDLQRTRPFSTDFGFDRGGAVDRYYIENFLAAQSARIRGRVLEIGDNEYTLRFGQGAVTQSDILHIDEKNTKATFTGDLSNAPQLPDNSFDCIVLTQTLQFIYHYNDALVTCYRILKPGGCLLLTVPGISHIDHGEWNSLWYWSFTRQSVRKLLGDLFSPSQVNVEIYGNVMVAAAFLYGMGLPELSREQLDVSDPNYQVIITATAIKPAI